MRPRADGFPSGVTLIARRGCDGLLAAPGARLHALVDVPLGATRGGSGGTKLEKPVRASAGRIELAVVGAHLSGLPLSGELLSRGASFLRTATTTADYRLYALPGTPPARPGLLRVADGVGAPIAVEVWSLAPSGFGDFVAGIPAPLGIGTLQLADGTSLKGFLVEAEGVAHARDVTRHGG